MVLALGLASSAAADTPDAKTLSRKLDQLYRSKSSEGTFRMVVTTPDYKRTLTIKAWSKGKDFTLMRITSPRKEAGITTLRRHKEMWNYLPKIRKTLRIPPSLMMGSWMGSDFTNDDLVRETSWEDDYTVALSPSSPAGQVCLDYVPRSGAAVNWSKVTVCFEKERLLPTTAVYFDEKKRKVRTLTYTDVKQMGGRLIPARMVLVPHLKEGRKTEVVYDDVKFDIPMPDSRFSLSAIRRGR